MKRRATRDARELRLAAGTAGATPLGGGSLTLVARPPSALAAGHHLGSVTQRCWSRGRRLLSGAVDGRGDPGCSRPTLDRSPGAVLLALLPASPVAEEAAACGGGRAIPH